LELRARVQALLDVYEQEDTFLSTPAAIIATPEEAIAEGPGAWIGPYKLLQQIGEGGFGLVFLAEQLEPVRRKVALKIVEPGMDSKQVIARFEAERQALALMDHPKIARVIDGGQISERRRQKLLNPSTSCTMFPEVAVVKLLSTVSVYMAVM
jgi:eukaryotic-like serine/threonine-protein kinase